MKAFVIDSKEMTIKEVEYSGDWNDIGKLGGFKHFDCVYLDDGDAIYVDDEGLLTADEDTTWFEIAGGVSALAGNGVVLGSDEEGETVAVKTTLEWLKENISFGVPGSPGGPLFVVYV